MYTPVDFSNCVLRVCLIVEIEEGRRLKTTSSKQFVLLCINTPFVSSIFFNHPLEPGLLFS